MGKIILVLLKAQSRRNFILAKALLGLNVDEINRRFGDELGFSYSVTRADYQSDRCEIMDVFVRHTVDHGRYGVSWCKRLE